MARRAQPLVLADQRMRECKAQHAYSARRVARQPPRVHRQQPRVEAQRKREALGRVLHVFPQRAIRRRLGRRLGRCL
eukprot:361754-Chlamydomonas_euryale.AAC.4